MAVYTRIDEATIQGVMGLYNDIGELDRYEGVDAGSINTVYRVWAASGTLFYLRIGENKSLKDLMYERDLIEAVSNQSSATLSAVAVPIIRRNIIGGAFHRLDSGKFAMLFDELKGRELAVFEIDASHTEFVGRYFGALHRVAPGLPRRPNPYGAAVLKTWLANLPHQLEDDELTGKLTSTYRRLMRARTPLPKGTIHGDLFPCNSKWHKGELRAVFDWEMAGRDALILDLAIGLHAWCWRRATPGHAAGFVPELCRALVKGYQAERPLTSSERRGLFVEAQLAALRFTLSRVRDFHIPEQNNTATSERQFLDYRDFYERLIALESLKPAQFLDLVGLAGA